MKRLLLIGTTTAVYLLHQDVWFWREVRPMLFGFLPVGLAYHLFYVVLVIALMALLVRYSWPTDLDR